MFKSLTNFIRKKTNEKLFQNTNVNVSIDKDFIDNVRNSSRADIAQAMIDDIEENGKLSSASLMMEAMGIVGPKDDEMPGACGEFGRTKTNPIPVNGIHSIRIYLGKLSRKDGVDFTWDRVGSTSSSNISGMVDIYEIYDEDEVSIDMLYICAYSRKTTNLLPAGYNKLD